jgi:hypothetical protein
MEHAAEIIKLCLRARYSFAIWVTGSLSLGLEMKFLRANELTGEFGKYLGAITGFAFVVWVVEIGLLIFEKLKEWNLKRIDSKHILEFFATLTESERNVLGRALNRNEQTINSMRGNDGTAQALVAKGLIQRASNEKTEYLTPFIIPTNVWKAMLKNKERFPVPGEEAKSVVVTSAPVPSP